MVDQSKKLILSPSRVGTYEHCPRKYYYRYIERIPIQEEQPHFKLGTFVHGALEYFHSRLMKDGSQRRSGIMKRSCEDFFRKMDSDGKTLTAEQLVEARNMLAWYLKSLEKKFSYEVISLEEKFTIQLDDDGEFGLTGIVDRLDRDADGILHIKDYKTNKNARYMKPFQLNVYGIWLLDKFPSETCYRGSYIMLRLGHPILYDFNRDDVEKCRRKLVEIAKRIVSEERWITKPGKLCDWCDFKNVCFNSW